MLNRINNKMNSSAEEPLVINPESNSQHQSSIEQAQLLQIDSNLSELEYQDTQIYSPSSLGGITQSVISKRGEAMQRSPASIKDKQIDILTDDLRRSIERLDKVIGKSALNSGHFSLKNKAAIVNKSSFNGTPLSSHPSKAKKLVEPKKQYGTKPIQAMRIEDPYQQ